MHKNLKNSEFDSWNILKKKLDSNHLFPTFQEREIWWCCIGINVGHEENGKNQLFNRPVMIVKKFNKNIFLGIPLTSKIKDNRFYHKIHLQGKDQSAMLSQIRVFESRRLTHKMAKITRDQFDKIKEQIKDMI
jgi:mRNA-degrading endonuclease toxin of MazEF toxin-antitoxin module